MKAALMPVQDGFAAAGLCWFAARADRTNARTRKGRDCASINRRNHSAGPRSDTGDKPDPAVAIEALP